MADLSFADVPVVSEQEYRDRCMGMANMLTARPERHNQNTWGRPAPENECGTSGCIAGWSALALNERVTIALDGGMTWSPDAVDSDDGLFGGDLGLVGGRYSATGRAWLGLSQQAASLLFYTYDNAVVIEVLRRVGDGRLGLDFGKDDIDYVRDVLGEWDNDTDDDDDDF